jgi:Cell Wall Hydrolase
MAGVRMAPYVDLPPMRVGRLIRRLSSFLMLLAAASCVPANTAYRAVPGLRGPDVTVEIDPMPEGMIAPRLTTTPLTPIAFDMADLPALDAVTNPAALAPYDPVMAGLPAPIEGTALLPIPTAPLPDFARAMLNPGPAVSAFAFRGITATDAMRSQLCLAAAIYYEAASESEEGQRAVAQVVLNRVRHPAYPNTVCDVVYQGTERGDRLCQFTFACDGSLARLPSSSGWARASRIARLALAGYVFGPVGTATHYHTLAVNPYWNKSLTATAIIGAHIFYRWGSAAGQPGAFYANYTGREPTPGPRPHPIRPLPVTPMPPLGGPAVIANGAMPTPGYMPPIDGSVAAIQAKAAESLLVQQAALARAAQRTPVAARPVAQDNRYVSGSLPESDIRPEFRGSGQWIGK